jgi:hypothetical protein
MPVGIYRRYEFMSHLIGLRVFRFICTIIVMPPVRMLFSVETVQYITNFSIYRS